MRREVLRLYPIIDLTCLPHADLDAATALVIGVLEGGATCVQLREKGERFSDLERLHRRIAPALAQAQVPLIMNDRLDWALHLNADGVHVGQRDTPVATLRAQATAAGRPDLIIGVSVTTVPEAQAALAAGADYLSVSPVFGTPTKPDAPPPAGLDGVRAIRAACPDTPLCAIGGIRPHTLPAVIAAGVDGVAFISAMTAAPAATLRAMRALYPQETPCSPPL